MRNRMFVRTDERADNSRGHGIGSQRVDLRFMSDGETYKRGAELGFAGIDFYFAGRGGVLGDVSNDVVASSFVFSHRRS
jgi:hypothetical protein